MSEAKHGVVGSFNPSIIYDWERSEDPLAPLSSFQTNAVLDLKLEIKELGPFCSGSSTGKCKKDIDETQPDSVPNIRTSRDFLSFYSKTEDDWLDREDLCYKEHLDSLEKKKTECTRLLNQVEASLKNLNDLNKKYLEVSYKTNSLHQVSEKLSNDQMKLMSLREGMMERLNHFKSLDKLSQALDTGMLSAHSPNIEAILDQINDHIIYHVDHKEFKESYAYGSRYAQCLRRLLSQIRDAVTSGLMHATAQASASSASHYAKFLASTHSIRKLVSILEARTSVSNEYEAVVSECQQCYVEQRESLLGPSVQAHMNSIVSTSSGDHCALMRSACAFLIHVSQDEHNLYHQFFVKQDDIFNKYLEGLCQSLYDTIRPIVVHMKHLETLAELCSILRMEMLQEHVSNNREALGAFGNVSEQLLQDVQERLVFRAHMYVQTDIAQYNPSPGDVAYPEKLHMMQSIAESLHQQELSTLSRSDSLASLSSTASQEVAKINFSHQFSNSSPADLHGMWYPPVRRTLTCLSRMYRCVDRPIFQGISQEALTACIASVKHASNIISERKTVLDGLMFLIKHLLILREQIAPFQVDFTVKEMSLDFSKMKTAAVELVNKRSRLFSLSSNNALLQFLFEGTPQVKQHWLDSRKDIDKTLKAACETFIVSARNHLLGIKLVNIIDRGESWVNKEKLKDEEWASSQNLSSAVHDSIKLIKSNLPALQDSMHLYLANRDTEFILYRPIKNSVIGCYSRLQQLVAVGGYDEESLAQIGCPTPEQAAIMLSSVSLQPPVPAPNRKLSTSSVQHGRTSEHTHRTHSKSESYEAVQETLASDQERNTIPSSNVTGSENTPSDVSINQQNTSNILMNSQSTTSSIPYNTPNVTSNISFSTQNVMPNIPLSSQNETPNIPLNSQNVTPHIPLITKNETPHILLSSQNVTPNIPFSTQNITPNVMLNSQNIYSFGDSTMSHENTQNIQVVPPNVNIINLESIEKYNQSPQITESPTSIETDGITSV